MSRENKYLSEFLSLKSAELLKKRALGPELAEEAHEAIELIMAERREEIPPRPNKALDIKADGSRSWLSLTDYIVLAIAASLLCFAWIKGATKHNNQILGPFIVYLIYRKLFSNGSLTSLMVAASEGDLIKTKYLLACGGVNVNALSPQGATALMFAAKKGDLDMVRTLIAAGADPALSTKKGETALSIARRRGDEELIKVLQYEDRVQFEDKVN